LVVDTKKGLDKDEFVVVVWLDECPCSSSCVEQLDGFTHIGLCDGTHTTRPATATATIIAIDTNNNNNNNYNKPVSNI
jgi:hypothetical protein